MLLHGTEASAVFSSHMHGYLQDARSRAQWCNETAQPSLIPLHNTTLLLKYKLDIKPKTQVAQLQRHSVVLPHKFVLKPFFKAPFKGGLVHVMALQKALHGAWCSMTRRALNLLQ